MQALQNASSSDPLLSVIKLRFPTFYIYDLLVDDTQIVCIMNPPNLQTKIFVIDFGASDRMPRWR